MSNHATATQQQPDQVTVDIADYVLKHEIKSNAAYSTARMCVMDTLGCGLDALSYPACIKMLGPVVPGTIVPNGAKVPGTQFQLDPVTAAFNIGVLTRWLDFNDAWTAKEWCHPSDNLSGILAAADYKSRVNVAQGEKPLLMRNVLTALIKAYELQGVIALENAYNRVGYDHTALIKVATTATVTALLGGSHDEVVNAVAHAWADGAPLRVYRQAPNTGSRKSWAAGDTTARSVHLALLALKGEMGIPTVLTAKTWGLYDVMFKGEPFKFTQPYDSYIMENVLFKISYPTAFHAQTAVECGCRLHPTVASRLDDIQKVVLTTHASAIKISDKKGPLRNPADRDHCLQYCLAIGLIKGNLTAADYEDDAAADPRIDMLREKTVCEENEQWTRDYYDPRKRSVPSAVQVFFKDGSQTDKMVVEFPLGHPRRREEGTPHLEAKFKTNLARRLAPKQQAEILDLCRDQQRFEATPVHKFVDLFVI